MNFHKDAKCKDCRFFFGVFGPGKIEGEPPVLMGGQCRINPPASAAILIPQQRESIEAGGMVMVPSIERVTTVPHVAPDFWCGAWKAREA